MTKDDVDAERRSGVKLKQSLEADCIERREGYVHTEAKNRRKDELALKVEVVEVRFDAAQEGKTLQFQVDQKGILIALVSSVVGRIQENSRS